jgi:hypothetical protein
MAYGSRSNTVVIRWTICRASPFFEIRFLPLLLQQIPMPFGVPRNHLAQFLHLLACECPSRAILSERRVPKSGQEPAGSFP